MLGRRRSPSVPQPLEPLQQLEAAFRSPVDVLYLGDSTVGRVADQDSDRRPLGEMVSDLLRPARTAWTWYSAYHLDLFVEILRAARRQRWTPRTLITPVNLRGFSPQWWGNPQFDYASHARTLATYPPNRPIGGRTPSRLAVRRHRSRAVGSPLLPGWSVGDAEDARDATPSTAAARSARVRTLFAFHYGVPISAAHPRLVALRAIAEEAAEAGLRYVPYITPINVEGAARFAGEELLAIIERNAALIASAVEGVVDLSRLLPATGFFHAEETTDHLSEHGRARLAAEIARAAR